ncbi:adenylate kinase [Spiroplasma endosymbiont of Panorpa germanica]|uniref:adenylate kinase n=1 Tax=Spiroplasma endosymbiont of Panorpa germanica TaxID=3066314 RepID=UPI0030D577E8
MNIILLGAPGSGKGTQAEKLVQDHNFEQLSTGDLFRKNINDKTEMGVEASKLINAGKLVPDDITNKMVDNHLKNNRSDGLIFDGYPRTINQAEVLNDLLKSSQSKIDKVILLEVDEEKLLERLVGRLICPQCKRSFHVKNRPPKTPGICDYDKSVLITRPDDSPEKISIRLQAYEKETKPLVEFYEGKGNLIKIKADNLTSQQVNESILKALEL